MEPRGQDDLTPAEYEELVTEIVRGLRSLEGTRTIRVDRGVTIQGASTKWALDVVWEFEDTSGRHLVFFECRYMKQALKQESLIAVKGRRDDLAATADTVSAVIVSRTGFQSGALDVAGFYGLIVLELRRPTPTDWHGRVREIRVSMRVFVPDISGLEWNWIDLLPNVSGGTVLLQNLSFRQAGKTVSIVNLLYSDEGAGFEERPVQPIERSFEPVVEAYLPDGQLLGTLDKMRANVGVKSMTQTITISGDILVAYYVKEALRGDEAFILADGRIQKLSSLGSDS
jgi:hypothetical protein